MLLRSLGALALMLSCAQAADLPHFTVTATWQAVPSLTANTAYRIFNVGDNTITVTSQLTASPPTTQRPDQIGERIRPRSYSDITFPTGEALYVIAAEFGDGRVLARPMQ